MTGHQQHDQQQARIEGIYARWREVLGLDTWRVQREYRDGAYVQGDGQPSGDAVASAHVAWEYRQAVLTFNTRAMADLDDETAESVVVHECMHVLLHELRDDRRDDLKHEERVATTLAWAFLRARDGA